MALVFSRHQDDLDRFLLPSTHVVVAAVRLPMSLRQVVGTARKQMLCCSAFQHWVYTEQGLRNSTSVCESIAALVCYMSQKHSASELCCSEMHCRSSCSFD